MLDKTTDDFPRPVVSGILTENIPLQMRELPNWVLWRLEIRDGRETKVPYAYSNKYYGASSAQASNWTSFSSALARVNDSFYGLGFMSGEKDSPSGIILLDLDHVIRDGEILPWAKNIIIAANSYCEISPSGDGLHIFFRGNMPGPNVKFDNKFIDGTCVEIYDRLRYFTVTGKVDPTYCSDFRTLTDAETSRVYSLVLEQDHRPKQKPIQTSTSVTDQAGVGERHKNLLTFAARMWRANFSAAELLSALRMYNSTTCNPPKDDSKIVGICNWMITKPRNTPDPEPETETETPPTETVSAKHYYDVAKKEYVIRSKHTYQSLTESQFKKNLISLGFSKFPEKGEQLSPVDIEIMRIREDQDAQYVGPLAGWSEGFYDEEERMLITSSPKIHAAQPGDWSMLRGFIERLLPGVQSKYLLAWIKIGYEALSTSQLRPGQAIAICGEKDCGKSLLQNLIVEIFGGRAAKPYSWMVGNSDFNGDMFVAESLIIEDEAASTDIRSRRELGARLKQITACDTQRCHMKYRNPITLRPFWRLTITMNDEPENLMVLPPIDESIADKIMLFKADRSPIPMPTRTNAERKLFWSALVDSIPAMLHEVIATDIPEEMSSDRFGVRHYHHPDILNELDQLSPEIKLLEMIDSSLFEFGSPDWTGTANDLEHALKNSGSSKDAERLLSWGNATGTYLGRLKKKHPDRFFYERDNTNRHWKILKS